ncbi:hypothetical protein [Rufibacter latericius]|uniref:Uncharacterized protein n=1 Tax=Rufibacter latericius TaxID=2487040 RepID=A0A3M9MUA3_9BACT|nr:hypothetical protein [Rufibacter latericius]RNI29101.1 hypothetical protein EFB08_06625 [Rufibacter latericius]
MNEFKVYYIRTKRTEKADWYMAGFLERDGVYFAKGYLYSKLESRYSKIFDGQVHGVKPALAKQFLNKHPGINGYASTGWMNYLKISERSPFGEDVMASFRSALTLFEAQYDLAP